MTERVKPKIEKPDARKQPAELKDEQLDEVQGGGGSDAVFKGEVVGLEPTFGSGSESPDQNKIITGAGPGGGPHVKQGKV